MTSSRTAVPAQLDFHTLSIPEALAAEEVEEQRGLSTAEAEERRRTFGPNRFAEGEQEPRLARLPAAVRRPHADRAAGRRPREL